MPKHLGVLQCLPPLVKSAFRGGPLWRAGGDYVDFASLVEFALAQDCGLL